MSGAVIMTYVLPMMLGQTYNLAKDTPGLQIFNETALHNNETIVHYVTDSHYRMVDDSSSVKDLLDIQGKLSLKVKAGLLDIAGQGSYLRDRFSRSHSTEILIRVNFETITQSIPTWWSPESDWTVLDRNFLGTHYCRSITYGGDLIASVRFLASNHFDQEKIKGVVQAGFNAKAVQSDLGAKLEKLNEELHDVCSMEIKYYATVPLPAVSHDIDGLMKLVDDFPKHVKSVNGGRGTPLRMELYPLRALEDIFPAYSENRALNDQLEDLEDQFDDLMSTRKDLTLWMQKLPPTLPETVEKNMTTFAENLNNIISKYYDFISKMDLSLNNISEEFDDVFEAYGSMMTNVYARELRKMQTDIHEEYPELDPVHSGGTYIHWGDSVCGTNKETIISGIALASKVNEAGGSSTFHCSSIESNNLSTSNHKTSKSVDPPTISPLIYNGNLSRYNEAKGKSISCAMCRDTRSTTVSVFYAFSTCPDDWEMAYHGFVMATGDSNNKGEYICVDRFMRTSDTSLVHGTSSNIPEIQEVSVKCGILPCENYQAGALKCVVCAKDNM